jgi:hypothetical protein
LNLTTAHHVSQLRADPKPEKTFGDPAIGLVQDFEVRATIAHAHAHILRLAA